jgi:tRNA(adenine34) deaminase
MSENILDDTFFMREALKEAQKATERDEVPVGAVVVSNGMVIARGHNMTECLQDVTAHAEIIAYSAASAYLGAKYLEGCTFYVTLEPCVMCAGALFWAQPSRVVFGASDPKRGYSKFAELLHPATEITKGVLANECSLILSSFFKNKRT